MLYMQSRTSPTPGLLTIATATEPCCRALRTAYMRERFPTRFSLAEMLVLVGQH